MIKLREYQQGIAEMAAHKLDVLKIVYLSMEVRTGKTLTALQAASILKVKSVLFVTKKKAIKSIENDYNLLKPCFKLTVINYESAHKVEGSFDLVVCDEAHSLGAFPKPSIRAKVMREIVGDSYLILMSGTPSPESFSQLYHQFYISKNSPFSPWTNFYKWAKEFVNKGVKYLYNREIADYSNAKKELIDEYTTHYFINYTQKEAGFDNQVKESTLICKMKPITYKLISKLNRDLFIQGNNSTITADTAVKLQNKVHQLSSGTVITDDQEPVIIDNSKALFIKEKFKGKKIAIFYKFQAELQMLKSVFDNITDSPEQFQESSNLIFAGQFQSAREGIRLDTADYLVFMNIDFSFLSYEQSRNRIISKEREKEAHVIWIFSDRGIEQKIYKAVQGKKDYTLSYYLNDYNIKRDAFRKKGANKN